MEKIGNILRHSQWQDKFDQEKRDRARAEELLKNDPDFLTAIKEIIGQHEQALSRLKARREEFLKSDKHGVCGDFAPYFRQRVFDEVLEGKRIPVLERGLKNMRYALSKAEGRVKINDDWQRKFNHATKDVRVGDVIRQFLFINFNGSQLFKCPFHEDKTASLKVYEKNNCFHCFGCGAHGSAINFVMKLKNCGFREAVEILSNF